MHETLAERTRAEVVSAMSCADGLGGAALAQPTSGASRSSDRSGAIGREGIDETIGEEIMAVALREA